MSELVRLYIWNLGDSKTTLGTPATELKRVRDLIGKPPEVAEEFDIL